MRNKNKNQAPSHYDRLIATDAAVSSALSVFADAANTLDEATKEQDAVIESLHWEIDKAHATLELAKQLRSDTQARATKIRDLAGI